MWKSQKAILKKRLIPKKKLYFSTLLLYFGKKEAVS
jgi:hypothetical protein